MFLMYMFYDGIIQKKVSFGWFWVVLGQKKLNWIHIRLGAPKLLACLQDVWNSAGCSGDDYHSISEDPSGALASLMSYCRRANCSFLVFSLIVDDSH